MSAKLDSPWVDPKINTELEELWKYHSCSEIAKILNEKFDLELTRNSVVGRVFRMGLTVKDKTETSAPKYRGSGDGWKPEKKPRLRKPRLRIVHGGNGGSLRLVETRSMEMEPLRCVEVSPLHLNFEQIENDSCRYPFGETNFTFCGHKCAEDSSYCPSHKSLCYFASRPPKQTAFHGRRAA